MEIKTCQFKGCKDDPEFSCTCSQEQTFYCEKHLKVHTSLNIEQHHNVAKNFIDINPGDKLIFCTHTSNLLSTLKNIKDNINKKAKEAISKILRQAVEDLEYVRKKEFLIMEATKLLEVKDKIIKKPKQSLVEEFIIEQIKSSKSIEEELILKEEEMMIGLDIERKEKALKDLTLRLRNDIENKIEKNDQNIKTEVEKVKEKFLEETQKIRSDIGLKIDTNEKNIIKKVEDLANHLKESSEKIQLDIENSIKFQSGIIDKKINETEEEVKKEISGMGKILDMHKEQMIEMSEAIIMHREEISELISQNSTNTSILTQSSKNMRVIFEELGLSYENDEFNDEKMFYFEDNTKKLIQVCVSSDRDSSVQLSIQDNMTYHGGFCRLSQSKCFVFGGNRGGTYIDIAYIVDIDALTAEKKTSWRIGGYTGLSCIFGGFIYAFGGYDGSGQFSHSGKYSLASNIWAGIQPLPIASYSNSSAIIGNEICITGYNLTTTFIYCFSNDSYLTAGNFQGNVHKVLCKVSKRLFVFDNNKLYESSLESFGQFAVVNNSTGVPNKYLICFPTRYKKDLYFALNNKIIYRLNLTTKAVSVLRAVNIS